MFLLCSRSRLERECLPVGKITIFTVSNLNYSDMELTAFRKLLSSQQDYNKMIDARITVLEDVLAKHFPVVHDDYQLALYNEYHKRFSHLSDKIPKPSLKSLDESAD